MRLLATAFLLVAAAPLRPMEPGRLLGPLAVRDMMPFTMLTMGFASLEADGLRPGEFALALSAAAANSLIANGDVETYLRDRPTRGPLTPAEIQEFLAGYGHDAYYFDGEIALYQLEFHLGITDRLRAVLQLPAYSFSGGVLDGFISGFHRALGIDQGMQDYVARDQFQMFLRLNGESYIAPDGPPADGLGDPTLGVRYEPGPIGRRWEMSVEAAAKVPAHGPRSLRSTGHADYGLQVTAVKRFARNGAYCTVNYVRVGDYGLLPGFDPNDAVSLTAGAEHLFSGRWSGVIQGTFSRSMFREGTASDLGYPRYWISLGLRRRLGDVVLSAVVTENMINLSNSPDIGFHLGLSARLGR